MTPRDQRSLLDELRREGVCHPEVLRAVAKVPRDRFVPEGQRRYAWENVALPIGQGQTISQPYVVACMTEWAGPDPARRVLEIGTGSGYQTAILAEVFGEVFTIEYFSELAASARDCLDELGYRNIRFRTGDGRTGWPEAAPFDAILVTAAPTRIPAVYQEQLKGGGCLVIPVGDSGQQSLARYRKGDDGRLEREKSLPVRFVPLLGEENGG